MFVITGGGSGIGRALARELSQRGKQVLIIGRQVERLEETANEFSLIETLVADVATAAGRETIVSHLASHKELEGLIHNAGILEPITPIEKIDIAAWQQFMAINLEAPLFLTQSLLHKLQKARVLHIGTAAAYFPIKGWVGYCVSKAGLSMLTRCWQEEHAHMAFASVMPGIVDTNMQAMIRRAQHMQPEKLAFFKELYQEDKLIAPEAAALFLCWLLLEIEQSDYVAKEWDIYDVTHHSHWLKPPHKIPSFE